MVALDLQLAILQRAAGATALLERRQQGLQRCGIMPQATNDGHGLSSAALAIPRDPRRLLARGGIGRGGREWFRLWIGVGRIHHPAAVSMMRHLRLLRIVTSTYYSAKLAIAHRNSYLDAEPSTDC